MLTSDVPLAVVNPREPTNWEVPVLPPNKRFVANRLVEVVFVPVAFIQVSPVTPSALTFRVVMVPLVA